MTYVQQALGTNDSGITLGPPETVGPNFGSFSKELMMEKGPFVYLTFAQVRGIADQDVRMFVAWFVTCGPGARAYISDVIALHDMTIDKPKWVAEKKVRFKQAAYDLYEASMQRVAEISASQGFIEADPADWDYFMAWWKKHDATGAAAATVLAMSNKTFYQVPAQLFEFWKANDQGNLAPPSSLLGLGVWSMIKRNWLWLGAGAVGGAAAYKALQRRRERKSLERAETMLPNCSTCK